MNIYHYHPETGEFIGIGKAERSPADNEEVYLIPAYATDIEPPEPINDKIRCFADGAWAYYDIPTPVSEPEPTEEELLQMQIRDVKRELSNLDAIVPRIIEDILEQGEFTIHQSKLDVIARKVELRQKIQQLGG